MGRGSVLAVLCAVSAGCLPELSQRNPYLVQPPPEPAGIRLVPHTFALGMISGRKADSVRMRVFTAGAIRTHGEGVSALKSYHAKISLDIPAFLIQHSSKGYVLFETGISPKDVGIRGSLARLEQVVFPYSFLYRQRKGQDIFSQLRGCGIDPRDVHWVILSRLDPETAGMADAFPAAEVVISRREWEWRSANTRAGGPPDRLSPEALGTRVRVKLVDLHNAPALGAFENGIDFFEDGSLFLVSLPGRTPGNMGLWLNLDNGPVLLTGGAAFVVDNVLDLALPVKGMMEDIEEYWRTLHIIRAMRKAVPQLLVVPGNDLSLLRLLRRADISVEKKKT
jgi:glyoxylase-like metal-dependent hydrolase (beta-lactamase superfamily II)